MNTSKLQKLAWVLFALALTTTTVLAQGRGNGNRNFQNQNGVCLNKISGLSEKQKTQIIGMEETHQKAIAELRTKRQATTNDIEKSEIRTEMLKTVEAHRNSVKKVLTDNQQKQYDQLHAFDNKQRNQQFGNWRGNRNYQGRGNGNRQFAQGNRGGSNRKQAGMNQGNRNNNRQNGSGCQGNNNRGNNGNGRGNGNRVNSSNS